jgi:hypothetical protein
MGFLEEVDARRDARIARRQAEIVAARFKWVGRVVASHRPMVVKTAPWLEMGLGGLVHGQVTEIDDWGNAVVLCGYHIGGFPIGFSVPFERLGVDVVLVGES